MNWQLLTPLLITTMVAIVGWFAAHRLAAARDRQNKRREMRVSALIDAYRSLEFSAQRTYDGDTARAVEMALADIQLLGTERQVRMAQQLMEEFAKTQSVDWQPLLLDLREDLQSELRLGVVPRYLKHLRWTGPKVGEG